MLYANYSNRVEFLLVYIKEAHPSESDTTKHT